MLKQEKRLSALPAKSTMIQFANQVDRHVGLRIKERRQQRGVTQQELARALGISYQQIQKYENGTNRVSAGRLYILAQALDLAVRDFYEDFDFHPIQKQIAVTSEDIVSMAKELNMVKNTRVRNSLRSLVRSLAAAIETRH